MVLGRILMPRGGSVKGAPRGNAKKRVVEDGEEQNSGDKKALPLQDDPFSLADFGKPFEGEPNDAKGSTRVSES